MKVKVKYMRESDKGVRFRYNKKMIWFPKSVLINWDDSKFYYYNEEFEIDVKQWFLKKLESKP